MLRKILIGLLTLVLGAVVAWADEGGDGGIVNLPGGRSGSRPGSGPNGPSSTSGWQAVVVPTAVGVQLRVSAEFTRGLAWVLSPEVGLSLVLAPSEDGVILLSSELLRSLRASNVQAFRVVLMAEPDAVLSLVVDLSAADHVVIRVED